MKELKELKKCKVVMVHSNEPTNLFLKNGTELEMNTARPLYGIKNLGWSYKKLFIISDDKVNIGDIYLYDNCLVRYCKSRVSGKIFKKIIASSERELFPEIHNAFIPDSFIRKFVESFNSGNPFIEIDIETEWLFTHDYSNVKEGDEVLTKAGEKFIITSTEKDECGRKQLISNGKVLCTYYTTPHNMLTKHPYVAIKKICTYENGAIMIAAGKSELELYLEEIKDVLVLKCDEGKLPYVENHSFKSMEIKYRNDVSFNGWFICNEYQLLDESLAEEMIKELNIAYGIIKRLNQFPISLFTK